MNLKELRKSKNLTQIEASKFLNIPLRTYQNYENEANKASSIKYEYLYSKLNKYNYVDEDTGILTIDYIKNIINDVFKDYDVEFCYLFGSYAKNKANESSDIDLLISTNVSGLKYYGLVESLREKLKKRIDLLNLEQLNNNLELLNEILKDGIKIYG